MFPLAVWVDSEHPCTESKKWRPHRDLNPRNLVKRQYATYSITNVVSVLRLLRMHPKEDLWVKMWEWAEFQFILKTFLFTKFCVSECCTNKKSISGIEKKNLTKHRPHSLQSCWWIFPFLLAMWPESSKNYPAFLHWSLSRILQCCRIYSTPEKNVNK